MDQDLLTLDQAREILMKFVGTNVSKSTFFKYIKQKGFPNHCGMGWPRRWRKSEIDLWISKQALDI